SPHLLTIGGVPQVLLLSDAGANSVAPADGRVLWKHSWPGSSILQPALTADGGVLIATASAAGGIGTRRLAVAQGPGGWTVEEVWTSSALKPYFNDFVVHNGHAFGFDGGILACIDLQDGKRTWKGGRYGYGQLLLLPDQDLLLVLSEEGELALVAAIPGLGRQDVEPPGAGRRHTAGAQRARDGRVPVVPAWRLTHAISPPALRGRAFPGAPSFTHEDPRPQPVPLHPATAIAFFLGS